VGKEEGAALGFGAGARFKRLPVTHRRGRSLQQQREKESAAYVDMPYQLRSRPKGAAAKATGIAVPKPHLSDPRWSVKMGEAESRRKSRERTATQNNKREKPSKGAPLRV